MAFLGVCARAAIWWAAGAAFLALGFALLGGGMLGFEVARRGQSLGEVQLAAWVQLYRVILSQGLLPHLAVTLAAYFGAVFTAAPWLDGGWLRVAATLLLASAVGFPVVGTFTFGAWQPTSAWDVVATMALMGGGTTIALLVARRLVPGLPLGAFARKPAAQPAGSESAS